MVELARGDQERWNRMAMALAWLGTQIRVAMYGAVSHGLAQAFSAKGEGPGAPDIPSPADLLETIPGYRKVEE